MIQLVIIYTLTQKYYRQHFQAVLKKDSIYFHSQRSHLQFLQEIDVTQSCTVTILSAQLLSTFAHVTFYHK